MKRLSKFGLSMSRVLARCVGTWRFVFAYSALIGVWLALHSFGVLPIDLLDPVLGWFAGIQASILLMDANARADAESRRAAEVHSITKTSAQKIDRIYKDINMIEELLEDLTQETDHEDSP